MSVLRCRDLCVGYRQRGKERPILTSVSLELESGQVVGLVGPNGAGKSTLLRTLAGLQPKLSGQLELLGRPLSEFSSRELARTMAVVLTDQVDPGRLRVTDLVSLGRHPHTGWSGRLGADDTEAVATALEAVGASQLAHRMLAELSDGQRQRALIARALAQEPSVLLLDEPTAFLDPPGRIQVFELLADLARERSLAVIISTHDVEVAARHVDQLWLLGEGPGVVSGSLSQLAHSGELEAAFGSRARFDPKTCLFISNRARPAPQGERRKT